MKLKELLETNDVCMNLVRRLGVNPPVKNALLVEMNKIRQVLLKEIHESSKAPVNTGSSATGK